jgi:predicted aldo/keto reductase-like oxidoreductase
MATRSLEHSLNELGTDYIDIFFLHYVTSDWVDGCRKVLRELGDAKASGMAKAIGVSTHSVKVVREAAAFEDVDVVLAVTCGAKEATLRRLPENVPLEDGSMREMFAALHAVHEAGKGVIGMKSLGTGAPVLLEDYRASIRSIARLGFVDALLIGMKDVDEVEKNVAALTAWHSGQ